MTTNERQEALRIAGAMLANCAYNLAQCDRLTERERRSLDESRKAWDSAVSALAAPPSEAGRVDEVNDAMLHAALAEKVPGLKITVDTFLSEAGAKYWSPGTRCWWPTIQSRIAKAVIAAALAARHKQRQRAAIAALAAPPSEAGRDASAIDWACAQMRAMPDLQRLLELRQYDDVDNPMEVTVGTDLLDAMMFEVRDTICRIRAGNPTIALAPADAPKSAAPEAVGCTNRLTWDCGARDEPCRCGLEDERQAAEQEYTTTAFDYVRDPVGSRDWTLFWKGWQARALIASPDAPSAPRAEGVDAIEFQKAADDRARGEGK